MGRRGAVALTALLLVLLTGCSTISGTGTPANSAGAGGRLTPLTGDDVLFFGDSWTSGFGSQDPTTDGFVPRTAQAFGWKPDAVSVAGGGYVKAGGKGQTFVERLRAAAPSITTPDLIVLQGGLNDRSEATQAVTTGFKQVVQLMRTTWPQAQIVVLGPMAPTSVAVKGVTAIDAALARSAASVSVPYLDAQEQGWLGPGAAQAEYVNSSKGNHPSTAGYEEIATRLVAALKDLGL